MKFGMLVNTQCPPDGSGMPRLYNEVLTEAQLADEVGFDLLTVPEHHMVPDGYLSAPLLFLAAVAARTKNIRLGTSIMHLPEWYPIHVAEEVAVLDNLSNGRVSLGVGLNLVETELNLFGIPRAGIVRRFTEAVEVLRLAWARETFSYDGEIFKFNEVNITPKPVQKSVPIWTGAMSEVALKRAARLGTGWISDPLHSIAVMRDWATIYKQAVDEYGTHDSAEIVLIRDGWVSNSDREVRETWWPTIRDYHLFYKNLGVFDSATGRFNTKLDPALATASDDEWTFDRIAPDRLVAGSPEKVIEQIERFREATGCTTIVFAFRHASGPDHEATMRCIRLFGEKVIPHFK